MNECINTKKDVKEAIRKAKYNANKATKAGILDTMEELMRLATKASARKNVRERER